MKQYDLLVIGFGKAGKTLAATFGKEGKQVALIEQDPAMYGGTCINIGCIPTKTMIVGADKGKSYEAAKATRDTVVGKLNAKNLNMLTSNPNVTVYTGHGKFTSNKEVEVTTADGVETLTAEIIIINTGATNVVLPIPGLSTSKFVYNSTELQALPTLPKRLGIIGCGNIGIEFANLYARLGAEVTAFESGDRILKREDADVAALAQQYLEEDGIHFYFNAVTKEIKNVGDTVVVVTESGEEFVFDALLHATGRKANTEGLGLEHTDIEVRPNGSIVTDDTLMTAVPNVFAVGDVNGGQQFTYVSLDDFRIVNRVLHGDESYKLGNRAHVPYSTFITPALSHVGLHEEEAKAQHPNAVTVALPVNNMPRHAVNQDPRGVFKLTVNKDTGHILGATLFGKNSEELINIIKMAMDNDIKYTYLRDQIFTHPTMAENLNDLAKLV